MYGKLHQSMFTGSMLGSGPDVFSVWTWIISHVVSGVVEVNPTLLAMIIGKITPEEVCEVLRFLCSPDEKSRTKDEGGRRIVPIGDDAGIESIQPGRAITFRVVNHAFYRDLKTPAERREYMKDYMRRKRSKPRKRSKNGVLAVNVRHTDAYAEADTNTHTDKTPTPRVSDEVQAQSVTSRCDVTAGYQPTPEALEKGLSVSNARRYAVSWLQLNHPDHLFKGRGKLEKLVMKAGYKRAIELVEGLFRNPDIENPCAYALHQWEKEDAERAKPVKESYIDKYLREHPGATIIPPANPDR